MIWIMIIVSIVISIISFVKIISTKFGVVVCEVIVPVGIVAVSTAVTIGAF